MVAIAGSLYSMNFGIMEIVPFGFICLQSFRSYFASSYSLIKTYIQYTSFQKRLDIQCPRVQNESSSDCPICIEPIL